jgi:glucose-1-phosphate adenylyltransferase
VLTQYKSDSLNRHIRLGWNIFNPELGEYVEINPPQMRLASHWYLGTADAIYQNIYTLEKTRPDYVLLLSGDHVYRMDYSKIVGQHVKTGADLTIASIPLPRTEARRLGVISVDDDMRVKEMVEKPDDPPPMPSGLQKGGETDVSLCSMGVYVFRTEVMVRRIIEDSKRDSTHDFGRDVVPAMIEMGDRVYGYRFAGVGQQECPYWKDVGTLDSYWQSQMEILSGFAGQGGAVFDLYDSAWPIRTYVRHAPPAMLMCNDDKGGEGSHFCNSLIGNASVVERANVRNSIIGPGVIIKEGSTIENAIVLSRVRIGRGVTVKNAVIDKDNNIPDGFSIGENRGRDATHFKVSKGGIVVVPKQMPLFRREDKNA